MRENCHKSCYKMVVRISFLIYFTKDFQKKQNIHFEYSNWKFSFRKTWFKYLNRMFYFWVGE